MRTGLLLAACAGRYLEEPDEARLHPACVSYSRAAARPFDPAIDAVFMEKMRAILAR